VAPIETDRLILREYTVEDAPFTLALGSDPDVLRYTGETPLATLEDARRMLREAPLADYATYGYGRLLCVLKGTGEPIGFSGLKYLPELGETDVGYRFLRPYWGRGFATESARAAMNYGRTRLGLERIVGLVDPRNRASVRVLEKLGLVFEKTLFMEDMGHEVDVYA
jgi:[ribosomal protein S5]-alanine N-acetyltransferase